MKLYRFSPIMDEAGLKEAIKYIVTQESRLSQLIAGQSLSLTYLTVFTHYDDEYKKLVELAGKWGDGAEANNGRRFWLNQPVSGVRALRIRQPDPYRAQTGCGDFKVKNYDDFKRQVLGRSRFVRLIERESYEMLELFHPDFDVLGYVVSKSV